MVIVIIASTPIYTTSIFVGHGDLNPQILSLIT